MAQFKFRFRRPIPEDAIRFSTKGVKMNKQMLEKAQKLSTSAERLLHDNREQYPVEWLLKERSISWGYTSKLEMITDILLQMNRNHPNYINTSPEDKIKVEKLIQNPEIVETVIVSLFQWFGTNVGKSDIGTLLDEIRDLKYKKPMSAQCKCVSEMHVFQTIGSTARPNPDCKICHGTGITGVM